MCACMFLGVSTVYIYSMYVCPSDMLYGGRVAVVTIFSAVEKATVGGKQQGER